MKILVLPLILCLATSCSKHQACDFHVTNHQADSGLAQKYQIAIERQLLDQSVAGGSIITAHVLSAKFSQPRIQAGHSEVQYAVERARSSTPMQQHCTGSTEDCSKVIVMAAMAECKIN